MTATLRSKRETLRTAPRRFRAPKSTGAEPKVDTMGGFRQQGVIRGVSLVTRGEALGHGCWLDADFLKSVAQQVNAKNKGVKSRFTHPSLSGDGLGTFLGRAMNAKVVGDQVIGEVHFTESGHETPDGDLASYVMKLAKDDPTAFGVSIVFSPDVGAEDRFVAENEDEDGYFHSPDADNTQNLPHARLASLDAADVVDDPAANHEGLFQREQDFAREADELVSFAFGISESKPATCRLGIDADRTAAFVARFLDQHGLSITRKDGAMPAPKEDDKPTEAAGVTLEQLNTFGTSLLAKVDEKLTAFGTPLAGVSDAAPGTLLKAGPTDAEIRNEERQRTKDLTNLFASAGLQDSAILDRWIDKGSSLLDAKGEIADLAIKQNKLVADDAKGTGSDSSDPKAKYRAEYRQDLAIYAKMEISEDDYINSRMVDVGAAVLGPTAKKPAA